MKHIILAVGLSMAMAVPAYAFQKPSPPSAKMKANTPICGALPFPENGIWKKVGSCNVYGGNYKEAIEFPPKPH